jgi:cytochrome c oxidase cbb3-type subunit 3
MTARSEHPLAAATIVAERGAPEAPSAAQGDPSHGSLLEHEYDGIREYDNPMPRWWVWMFAGSFFFSVAYFFHYHVSHNGVSVAQAYEHEVREARALEAQRSMGEPVSEDSLAKLMVDAESMSAANVIFSQRCAACHGDRGQGLIGPNLTDDSWVHGAGGLGDIYRVVEAGVAAKGMPAWGRLLSPAELRRVSAFVGTLRGTNVPGRAAEGMRAR